jgi:hypothetical protein
LNRPTLSGFPLNQSAAVPQRNDLAIRSTVISGNSKSTEDGGDGSEAGCGW